MRFLLLMLVSLNASAGYLEDYDRDAHNQTPIYINGECVQDVDGFYLADTQYKDAMVEKCEELKADRQLIEAGLIGGE